MRARIVLTTVWVLMATACTGSASNTTATTSASTGGDVTTTALAPDATRSRPEMPSWPDDDEELAIDDDVTVGTLPNGVTYYIRENRAPGGRAQLRLAVEAGSIQESPDQRGAAHYLEHMMFNGTQRYPANELVRVLQRFGAEFGADINAYTSYEETVYQLEIPTDDPETLATAFDVLYEWATAATLDPVEVDLERGVLVEEWRLRDQGFWGRYFAGVSDGLLAGTEYEGRRPLGSPDEVAATTVEGLRDFYETWYRSDTMAVVAVGDFVAADVEALIADRFGAITPPEDPRPVPAPTTNPASEAGFMILTDPETVESWVELNYPLPAESSPATVGAVRRSLALELAWKMLVQRLNEASLRGSVPFWNPSFAANPLVRGQRSPGLAAYTDPENLSDTAQALLESVERASTHGFSAGELERAITDLRGDVQLEYDERATTQDRGYAERYVEHFLGSEPIAAADDWYELQLRLLDEMTADDVWNVFGSTVGSTEPFVIVVAPESDAAMAPDVTALAKIVDRVERADYEPWVDTTPAITTLMERPDPARIDDRSEFSDTVLTELTLENGARVVFVETDIRDDVVVFGAASPGGWSLLDPHDVAEAQMAPDIATASGVGVHDQVTLDRFLSAFNLSLTPYVEETEEGFFGEAATRDLESLLQLVHLYMTAPRFEEVALDIAVAEILPFAADPGRLPDLAVAAAAAEEMYAGDPRFAVVPPLEDLTTLDLDTAADVFRDRFDDPGDFVFVFAGDFDQGTAEDLARSYLGTIPGPGDSEAWMDVRPDPPAGVIDRTVEAGTGELGGISLLFGTDYALDPVTRVQIDLLESVLQQRLTERIREELSASYSPFASFELIEAPLEGVEIWIQVSADPTDLDEITNQTLAVLADLRTSGPTDDELAIAAEQLRRNYELISNEQLAQAVIFSFLHPDEGLFENVIARIDRTAEATRADIRDLAGSLLPADRYIEIRLVPIGRALEPVE